MEEEDIPLPILFDRARKIHLSASDYAVDPDSVKKGIHSFQKCEDMVQKLALFSSNETKDDISTTNLKYVLVPFYLAELMDKSPVSDRLALIKGSRARLQEFMSFCEAMEFLPQDEFKQLTLGGSGSGSNQLADKRALKIARFKRQKAAESKLLEIKERKERRGRSTKAAALSTPVETAEEEDLEDDGEEEREAWLTSISLAICKTLDMLEHFKREEELLVAVKQPDSKDQKEFSRAVLDERTKTAEDWHRNAVARARYQKPAQPITCAAFAQDVLEGRANASQVHEHKHQPVIFGPASLINASLTNERDRIAAQVFQPSYRLPTMSIEEAGLKEMEIMNKFQERNAKLMEEANSGWYKDNSKKPGPDDEDEYDDAAVEKARAWDDWKDENPRGAGNKKLTPCG